MPWSHLKGETAVSLARRGNDLVFAVLPRFGVITGFIVEFANKVARPSKIDAKIFR
jgi:hypothetical protein